LGALGPAQAGFEQIGGKGQPDSSRFIVAGFESVKITSLFIDDPPVGRRNVEHRKVRVSGQTFNGFRVAIEAVQVEFAVPVGAETEVITEPGGIGVVAATMRLRDLLN